MAILDKLEAAGEKLRGTSKPPVSLTGSDSACPLEVVVLHTETRETLDALKAAANLAQGLDVRIRLLVPQIVPIQLPVDQPDISLGFTRRRFQTLASHSRIETLVDIRLGREKREILASALKPHSVVVLGGKRPWWPGKVRFMANRLAKMGHHVVFAEANSRTR